MVSPKEEEVDSKGDCGCLGVDGGLYVGRGGLVRHTATSLCASSFHDTQALFVSDHQAFFRWLSRSVTVIVSPSSLTSEFGGRALTCSSVSASLLVPLQPLV